MSHEIRTPMNAVLGLAQVLNREPLSVNQHDMVGSIQAAGQSLLTILNDILDFSKIEAGQLRLETRPFDLAEALARVESLMGQTAQAKGLTLTIATPAESLGALLGDGLRLEQVLGLEGATATLAADGQQAVQHLKARPAAFDAVLMDARMPVMDGLTATRLIRQQLGLTALPIIALTAGVLADEQQAAREAGMNGLLPKPIDLEQLVDELRR